MHRKIIAFKDVPSVLAPLRAAGKKIVQCHGTFDLVHPGHIVHFEEAKALGDVLVVTLTGDAHVNKGPGRPYFSEDLRARFLAALECVDFVSVVPHRAAVETIECVRPDVYCKGKEYENQANDVTGNIADDLKTVKAVGGRVCYVGSVQFSSTKLLNQNFEPNSPEVSAFCRGLAAECSPARFKEIVGGFADLSVLIVGDSIFDRYSAITVQGLTSKNRILSGRFLSEETQAGGAMATLRHVRQFTSKVKLVTLLGTEQWADRAFRGYVQPDEDEAIRAEGFTTIVKQRFVEPLHEGKELSKLFAVNYIDARHPGPDIQRQVMDKVRRLIGGYDLVFVMDFGHGLMAEAVRDLVQEKSRFMALNCQTNSNNTGFNLIDKQYRRADSFSLDERELCLACGKRNLDFTAALADLQRRFGASYAWLTRGGIETIGVRAGKPPLSCPPFEVDVVDTVGAGDAFCAVTSLAAVKGLPLNLATFMGQLAGAQAVRIVGNSESIKRADFLKAGMAMLNY